MKKDIKSFINGYDEEIANEIYTFAVLNSELHDKYIEVYLNDTEKYRKCLSFHVRYNNMLKGIADLIRTNKYEVVKFGTMIAGKANPQKYKVTF